MLIPAVLYGELNTIGWQVAKLAARIHRGERLLEVVAEDGMLDTDTTPGQIMMTSNGPDRRSDFHCYLLAKLLAHELYAFQFIPDKAPPLEDEIFADALTVTWGVLGMIAYENHAWVRSERYETFLQTVVNRWDEISELGARFFWQADGERLWSIPSNLHFALANVGVSHRQLHQPLPQDGLREMVRKLQYAN